MQIDSVEVFHVALPLREPLVTGGRKFDKLATVVVRMASGEAAGWGEACPGAAPLAGIEWAAGVFGCLRDWLAPAVTGRMVDSGDHLQKLLAVFRGNQFAKSALDTAWWDLRARLDEQPLWQALGGQTDAVEVGMGFDQMDSVDAFLEGIGAALEAGFSRVELKFRPGWDFHMLGAVRQGFPTQDFHIDCEAGMRLEHMDMLYRLEDFGLVMIEQPFPADDLVGHAMAQESVKTPICLDESITTLEQAEMALELHSCQYIDLKVGRVGGLTPAVAIHDVCKGENLPCWVGIAPQSAIGTRIGLALAAKENFTYPADYFFSDRLFEEDLAEPPLPTRDNAEGKQRVALWSAPGIGVEPRMDLLEKLSLDRVKL